MLGSGQWCGSGSHDGYMTLHPSQRMMGKSRLIMVQGG